MKGSLTRIVPWGHQLLSEVVGPGDLAVDLTAGTGQDTLALCQFVGVNGRVISFDIQTAALEKTTSLLRTQAVPVCRVARGAAVTAEAGASLVADGHENFASYVKGAPRAVIANLGYLPGGDQDIITRPDSTLEALRQASRSLAVGGRLAVVVYPGHPGGAAEAAAVSDFFAGLPEDMFQGLLLRVSNRPQAPFLHVAEKLDHVLLKKN